MNFVARVEENLRDLGTEARRKHPGVKEASERGILTLRTCQAKYVAAVRKATSAPGNVHPTTRHFRSQDVLRPFLLAANYPDASARILDIALGGIELLLDGDAVCDGDEMHIVRVLGIQAGVCCDTLGRAESSSGHGGMRAGVGAAGSAAAGAVGAVIGGNWSVFGGSSGSGSAGGASSGSGKPSSSDSAIAPSSSADADHLGGLPHGIGSSGTHAIHSTRSVKEDEAAARRILKLLITIVASPGLGLTEEVFAQCLTVCLMLRSCGSPETVSVDKAIDVIMDANRAISGSCSGEHDDVGGLASHAPSSSQEAGKKAASRIRRLASLTLNQIVLTLFKRASAALAPERSRRREGRSDTSETGNMNGPLRSSSSSTSPPESSSPSNIRSLAVGTFLDLCALAALPSDSDRGRRKQHHSLSFHDSSGPFAKALASGGASMGNRQGSLRPPSRATSVWIMGAVLKENADLFRHTDRGVDNFPSLLQKRVCPLIVEILSGFCSHGLPVSRSQHHYSKTDSALQARKYDPKTNLIASVPVPKDLALLLASINLARTIISEYGSIKNDRSAEPDSESPNQRSSAESLTLVTCLLRLIVSATESIRDTEGFEDGYVYDRVENEILFEGVVFTGDGGNLSSTMTAPVSGASLLRPKKAARDQSIESSQQSRGSGPGFNPVSGTFRAVPILPALFWGAAFSLEVLHCLILTRLSSVAHLLTPIAEAASDFAAVGGSCAESIKGVVVTAHREHDDKSLSESMTKVQCVTYSSRAKELLWVSLCIVYMSNCCRAPFVNNELIL